MVQLLGSPGEQSPAPLLPDPRSPDGIRTITLIFDQFDDYEFRSLAETVTALEGYVDHITTNYIPRNCAYSFKTTLDKGTSVAHCTA